MKAISAMLLIFGGIVASQQARPAASPDVLPPDALKNARLGLWEETIESSRSPAADVDMSHMDMSALSPDQRARVEAVLKRQHAEHAAQGSGPVTKSRTKQFCLKPGEAMKSFGTGRDARDMESCKASEVSRTSTRVALRVICAGEGAQATTDIVYEVKSPTETVGEIRTKGTVQGREVENSEKAAAHWIGAECGSVQSAR